VPEWVEQQAEECKTGYGDLRQAEWIPGAGMGWAVNMLRGCLGFLGGQVQIASV